MLGVKATSGGTFDPHESPLYFIASNPEAVEESQHRNVLVAVNELNGPRQFEVLDRLCDTRKVLLDSGIFNLAMGHAKAHGLSMDTALTLHPTEVDGFTELRDRFYGVVGKYADRLWGVIELDQGGAKVKPDTRAMIERDTGVIPIPVYHPLNDGWDYFDTIASGYDRICFGNLVKAAPPTRLRLMHTAAERARAYPYLWTHFLGVHPNENWLGMNYRGSCDSSSWLTALRWMPSWKAWSLLKMNAHFPPDMWYTSGGVSKGEDVTAATARFTQDTLEALKGDTHPWLAHS